MDLILLQEFADRRVPKDTFIMCSVFDFLIRNSDRVSYFVGD